MFRIKSSENDSHYGTSSEGSKNNYPDRHTMSFVDIEKTTSATRRPSQTSHRLIPTEVKRSVLVLSTLSR